MILKKNKAFLLIEVLVTVLIVSTSIVFINHAFTSSLRATALTADYVNAVFFLEDKSFDFELPGSFTDRQTQGEAEFMAREFSWDEETSALDEEETGAGYEEKELDLEKLTFSVKWKRQNTQRSIDIITYIRTEDEEDE